MSVQYPSNVQKQHSTFSTVLLIILQPQTTQWFRYRLHRHLLARSLGGPQIASSSPVVLTDHTDCSATTTTIIIKRRTKRVHRPDRCLLLPVRSLFDRPV